MHVLRVIWGLGSAAVLVWMASRLVRAPRDVPLWSVAGLLACWTASSWFADAPPGEDGFLGLSPVACRFAQLALLQAGANCMICFFLFSALDVAEARRRAAWYALPLVAAVAVQAAAERASPAGVDPSDCTVTSLLVLNLTSLLYMVLAFAVAWVWTRRYARRAEPLLARGLRIASSGQAAIVVADTLLAASALIVNWTGDASPYTRGPDGFAATLAFTGRAFLLPGAVLFLTGISYKSVAMRAAALRIWWRHLRAYHRLRPLWAVLHRHFPGDTLHGAPAGRWRDVLNPRGVHRRYYRRVIECRDGLVHISPYLAAVREEDGGDGDRAAPAVATALAGQLREALRARTAGTSVSTTAMPIGIPAEEDLDADARELIALSRALHTAEPGGRGRGRGRG